MIIGIGTDIVQNSRFIRWLENPALLQRFFHAKECEQITKNKHVAFAASRFAAKEAFVKALGTGFRTISLKNICTQNYASGKPYITLYNNAQTAFKKSGAHKIHISISHEKEYTIAFVILEE